MFRQFLSSSSFSNRNRLLNNVAFGLKSSATSRSLTSKIHSKAKTIYKCKECGQTFPAYLGKCNYCNAYGSIIEQTILPTPKGGASEGGGAGMKLAERIRQNAAIALEERSQAWVQSTVVSKSLAEIAEERGSSRDRIQIDDPTGKEMGRVLGGGIVKGSLVLLGGDPGVGKSTLLLQMLGTIAKELESQEESSNLRVLYVSSEESAGQIHDRAIRLGFGNLSTLRIMTETRVESIISEIKRLEASVVIMDSIQSVFSPDATGSAGGFVQVRECAVMFSQFAKITNIPIFIVGHVTKSGEIAGSKVLEHIVDVVLYLEGERNDSIRILRGVKNRYGPTNEIGLFEMRRGLLAPTENPNAALLEDTITTPAGVASIIFVSMDNVRPVLIEIQALSTPRGDSKEKSWFQSGARIDRFFLLTAVLRRHVYRKLHQVELVLNVLGGLKVQEPAGDLAIAIAIMSAALDQPIDDKLVAIGEIGLGGELRSVPSMEKRLVEIAQLGFKKVVIPYTKRSRPQNLNLRDLEVIECSSIHQALERILGKSYLANAMQRQKNQEDDFDNDEL